MDDVSYSGGNASETASRLNFDVTPCLHMILAATHLPTLKDMLFDLSKHTIIDTGLELILPCEIYPDISIIEDYFWTSYDKPAVYLDHKLASPMSTFSLLYEFSPIPDRPLNQFEKNDEACLPPGKRLGSLFKVFPSRGIIEVLQEYHSGL